MSNRKNWRDTRPTIELFWVVEQPGEKFVDEPKVEVVESFKVQSYDEAKERTKKYNEEHSDGKTYYWRVRHCRDFGDFGLWHCDGIISYGASDVDNVFIDWIARTRVKMRKDKDLTNHKHWVKKIARIRKMSSCKVIRGLLWTWLKIWDNATWWLWEKPKDKLQDWRWNRRNTRHWKKTGHALSEPWALPMHMLYDLKFNLKKIMDSGYGINTEFMYDVLRGQNPGMDATGIEEKMKAIMMNTNRTEAEKVENLAVKLQNDTYEHIRHLVDLYTFYLDQQIDDKEPTKENMTPDMQYYTLDGTYDMLDYKKMLDESQKVWNEIWDLVKKYGQQMND